MTDPTSPEIQAIFAQLHALGVTPEQAAAGVRALTRAPVNALFAVGDRVLLARKVESNSDGRSCGWQPEFDQYVETEGTVNNTDYETKDGMEVRVAFGAGECWWFSHEALDLIEPGKLEDLQRELGVVPEEMLWALFEHVEAETAGGIDMDRAMLAGLVRECVLRAKVKANARRGR